MGSNVDEDREPWYRPRNIALAILLLVSVSLIWLGIWVRSVIWAQPTMSFNAFDELNKLAMKDQPQGEDAWPIIIEVVQRLVDSNEYLPGFRSDVDLRDALAGPWDVQRLAVELELTSAILDLDIMDLLDQTVGLERSVHTYPSTLKVPGLEEHDPSNPLWMMLLPELGDLHVISRALLVSMRQAAEERRHKDVVRAFTNVLCLGRHTGMSPLALEQGVGLRIMRDAFDELQMQIGEHLLDEPTYRAILKVLDRFEPSDNIEVAIETEFLQFLDMVQRVHTDNGRGDGIVIFSEITKPISDPNDQFDSLWDSEEAAPRVLNFSGYDLPRREESIATAELVRQDRFAMSKLNSVQRSNFTKHVELGVFPVPHELIILNAFYAGASYMVMRSYDETRASLQALRISLALELHRLERGTYPDTLDQLAPGFFTDIPTDPTHDGPFIYRLLSDDSRGYILYSTGVDQTDDGGKMDKDIRYRRDLAFVSGRGEGLDYVFNLPRPPLKPDN